MDFAIDVKGPKGEGLINTIPNSACAPDLGVSRMVIHGHLVAYKRGDSTYCGTILVMGQVTLSEIVSGFNNTLQGGGIG